MRGGEIGIEMGYRRKGEGDEGISKRGRSGGIKKGWGRERKRERERERVNERERDREGEMEKRERGKR